MSKSAESPFGVEFVRSRGIENKGIIRAHIALIFCNLVWACDYPFYNLLLGKYLSPLAMVTASLVVAALLSWIPVI